MNLGNLENLNLGNLQTVQAGSNEAQPQAEENDAPQTSLVTVFVSGKNPGEFSKVVSTVTLTGDENNKRFKRSDEELLKLMLAPSRVQPVLRTMEPSYDALKYIDEDNFSANVNL